MTNRSVVVFTALLLSATTARAANQLYRVSEVSWSVKAFGNECSRADPSPGPHCGNTSRLSYYYYSAVGLPQGIQCNPNFPRCPFSSTPTDGSGNFFPLAGWGRYCAPWYNWGGNGTAERPDKGMTPTTGGPWKRLIPPLYRNPAFFTSGGAPGTTWCTAASTGFTPDGKGRVQAGNPVTGSLLVSGTGGAKGGFDFPVAGVSTGPGLRASGVVGEFYGTYGDPAGYTYTYATLRNSTGIFGPSHGPGSFNIKHHLPGGKLTDASINVRQGAAKFGGTMRMLGALTSKHCYYRNGGCSRGSKDWLYNSIGASVYMTLGSPITHGYLVYGTAMFFNTALGQSSTINIEGSRFPWTTGSVTVTAVGRGNHNTIHYAQGYDNRTSIRSHYSRGVYLVGTLQLVTPVLTRWLQPAANYETVGIGILRFVPEPHTWVMLIAGVSLLCVGARMRGR
jgi:hypothetical protein